MNKIIVVDDHSLFREGMKLLIENEGLGNVIAEAENGQELLNLLDIHKPDLVIMDIEMPVMNGIEATKQALKLYPEVKILILTMLNGMQNYSDLVEAGAMGLVMKTAGKNEFQKAINSVVSGDCYFSNELLRMIIQKGTQVEKQSENRINKFDLLTRREMEVLTYFCQGFSVTELADKIFLSPKTIEAHRSNLLRKTETKNTLNLVLYAIKNNIIEI